MPAAHANPDAYLDCSLPVDYKGSSGDTGGFSGALSVSLFLAYSLYFTAPGESVSVAGSGCAGYLPSDSGGGKYVGTAEDVNAGDYRPQTAVTGEDDAVDDAAHVWFLLFIVPQWTGSLLGNVNYHQSRDAILYGGLGRVIKGGCARRAICP